MNATNWFSTSLKMVQEVYSKAVSEGLSPAEATAMAAQKFRDAAEAAGLPEALVQQWVEMMEAQGFDASIDQMLAELGGQGADAVTASSFSTALLSQSLLALGESEFENVEEDHSDDIEDEQESSSVISKPRSEAQIEGDIVPGTSGLSENLTASSDSDTLSYEDEVGDHGVIVDLSRGIASDAQGGIDNISGFTDVRGSAGDDYIVGDDQDNHLEGLSGADTLIGGEGNDYFMADSTDSIEGGAGLDTLDLSSETLTGGESFGDAEVLVAGAGNDIIDNEGGSLEGIYAGAGDDEIISDTLITSIDGGEGFDVVDLYGLTDTSTLDLNSLVFSNVEELQIDSGDLTVTGSLDDASVFTGSGDDLIMAGSGNDTFGAGEGDDTLDGGEGSDVLMGEGGDDAIEAGEGNDTLDGGEGSDVLMGEGGDDAIDAGEGNDILDGGEGADVLSGEGGNDVLIGHGGDVLLGGEGNDSISAYDETDSVSGGEGVDTLSYSTTDGVNVDLSSIEDIEVLNGTSGDDDLSGLANFSVVNGGEGNDVIEYAEGVTVDGGEGADLLDASSASEAITGNGPFSNIESILGSEFSDTIEASDVDYISGGLGDDHFGLSGIDGIIIDGGEGNDVLDGSTDTEGFEIDVNDGGVLGMESILGGSGDDEISTFRTGEITGSSADEILIAGDNSTYITGAGGNDTLEGGPGDDTLDAGEEEGSSSFEAELTGGAGADVFTFDFEGSSDTINVQTGTEPQMNVHTGTTMVPITTTTISGTNTTSYPSPHTYTTTSFVPVYAQSTVIEADAYDSGTARITDFVIGEDVVQLNDIDDIIDADNASETSITVSDNGTDVVIDLGEGGLVITLEDVGDGSYTSVDALIDDGIVSFSDQLEVSVESGMLIDGGAGNDYLEGGDHGDTILGGIGDDTLDYLSAASSVDAGADDDLLILRGGSSGDYMNNDGADALSLHGGEGEDTLEIYDGGFYDLQNGSGIETIVLDSDMTNDDTVQLQSDEGQFVVFGGGNDSLQGGDGSDTFAGSMEDLSDANRVDGEEGDDLLILDVGTEAASLDGYSILDDIERIDLHGAAESVSLTLDSSDHEIIDASALTGDVNVSMTGGDYEGITYVGGSGNDSLEISENDSYSDGGDYLEGNAGDDYLSAGDGADYISGGSGDDALYGENGEDYLVFDDGIGTFDGGNDDDVLAFNLSGTADVRLEVDGYDSFSIVDADSSGLYDNSIEDIEALHFGNGDDTIEIINDGTFSTNYVSLDGGLGDDLFIVNGEDVGDFYFSGGQGALREGGEENNLLMGDEQDNLLYGGDGTDDLIGGAGDDTLDPGEWGLEAGTDSSGYQEKLTGGEGSDVFHFDINYTQQTYGTGTLAYTGTSFEAIDQGQVLITDFTIGEDVLMFENQAGEISAEAFDDDNFSIYNDGNDLLLHVGDGSTLYLTLEGLGDQGIESYQDLVDLDMVSLSIAGYVDDGSYTFVTGGEGNDVLEGTSGDDIISGGTIGFMSDSENSHDTVTGGEGSDIFNVDLFDMREQDISRNISGDYGHYSFPIDEGSLWITDFEVGVDVLNFNSPLGQSASIEDLASGFGMVVVDEGDDLILGLSDGYDGLGDRGIPYESSDFYVVLEGLGDGAYESFQDLVDAGIVTSQQVFPEDEVVENDVVSLVGGTDEDESFYVDRIAQVVTDDESYDLNLYGDVGQIILGAGNDELRVFSNDSDGEDRAAYIDGGAGNDSIHSYREDDTLVGGLGDDTLYASSDGADLLLGGAGDDSIIGYDNDNSGVTVDAGADDDYVKVSSDGEVSLVGGAGMDTLDLSNGFLDSSSYSEFEVIISGGGNDTFDSSDFGDVVEIDGGAGDDYFTFDNLDSIAVSGGEGNDVLDLSSNTSGVDVSMSGSGFETILTGSGDDTIEGISDDASVSAGMGDDALYFAGAEVRGLDGGEGDDSLFVMDAMTTSSGIEASNLSGIENIILDHNGDNDDNMDFFSSSDDVMLIAGGGNDNLVLGAGDDTVQVASEDFDEGDYFRGGDGSDLLLIDVETNGDTISSNDIYQFEEVVISGSGDDYSMTLNGIDLATVDGSQFDGDLTVNASGISDAIMITGGGGNDSLVGGTAADTLEGGTGDDSLVGNAGRDYLVFGQGSDSYDGGSDSDILSFGDDSTTGLVFFNTTSSSAELIHSTGTAVLTDIEILDLGAGDDFITLNGDENSLTVLGGAGVDTISLNVNNLEAYELHGEADRFIEGSSGSDSMLSGSDADDILYGGELNDTLIGGAGDDTLDGGLLGTQTMSTNIADHLTGGAGSDVFNFDLSLSTSSTIFNLYTTFDLGTTYVTDFVIGEDVILLSDHASNNYDITINNVINGISVTDNGTDVTLTMSGLSIVIQGIGDGTLDSQLELYNEGILDFGGAFIPSERYLDGGVDVLELTGGNTGSSLSINAYDINGFNKLITDDASFDLMLNGEFEEVVLGAGSDRVIDLSSSTSTLIEGGAGNDVMASSGGSDTLDGGSGDDIFDFVNTVSGVGPSLTATVDFGTDTSTDNIHIGMNWGGTHTDGYSFTSANLFDYGSINILNFGSEDSLTFFNEGGGFDSFSVLDFENGFGAQNGIGVDFSEVAGDVVLSITTGSGLSEKNLEIILEGIGNSYVSLDDFAQTYNIDFDGIGGQGQA